jgi:tRNA 2-thiouridine synthesizing protein A
MSTKTLDAKGLSCPLPVLKARRAMQDMKPGEVLEVLATDPAAPKDFLNFCEVGGHEMLATTESGGVFSVRIRKAG